MKYALLVFIFTLSSCTSTQYTPLYSADTTGKGSCYPVAYNDSIVQAIYEKNYTKEDMQKAEEVSGYSECENVKPDADSLLTVCKKPIIFKQYMSKKRASCDKFMADNNLH